MPLCRPQRAGAERRADPLVGRVRLVSSVQPRGPHTLPMRYRLPPLNTLRIFEAIYRRGSIRQAADELCLTPQAVSQQLKILESSLGTDLFERTARSLAPTEAARQLYEPIQKGFEQFAAGINAVTREASRDSLYLHVSPYFATHYLVRNLGNFTAQYPDLELRMSVGVEMVDLDDHQGVDAAIHWGYGEQGDLEEIALIEDLKVLVAAPSLLARLPINAPEDLLRHSLVLPLTDNSLWQDTMTMLGLPHDVAQPALKLHTHDAMLEAVMAGLGIGFISYLDALDQIKAGTLVAPLGTSLLTGLSLERSPRFFLYYKRDPKNAEMLERFKTWLLDYICRPEIVGYVSRTAGSELR